MFINIYQRVLCVILFFVFDNIWGGGGSKIRHKILKSLETYSFFVLLCLKQLFE